MKTWFAKVKFFAIHTTTIMVHADTEAHARELAIGAVCKEHGWCYPEVLSIKEM